MTSILVAMCTFSDKIFERLYLKKERLFWIFYCISEMCMKFTTFWNKEEYPSLIITEIIAFERDVYLSVYKVLLQHTIR